MLLLWLILIPFIGSLFCLQCERFGTHLPRFVALIAMGLNLALSLLLWNQSIHNSLIIKKLSQWQMEYIFPWIPRFGINIHLALDGLSLLMIVLTSILGVLSVLCSWREIKYYQGFFYLNLLWILGSVTGIFLAIDMFLFFFFWEMMLVPIYYLIVFWGHKPSGSDARISAATKFFIYAQASSLIMLTAILGLVLVHYNDTNIWTFNYEELLHTVIPENLEYLLMLGFFLAFAIKIPIVPLHGWLPDAHAQSPTAGSVDMAGILLKTAAYGILRFILPLFPHASYKFAPIAMWLGIGSIFYGALLAFSQTDIKRLVAYVSISHMGLILIAIYSGNQLACQGAIMQMIAHSLSVSGMFIICGQLYERLHTRDIRKMGGLWNKLKFIPALSLFFATAMLSIPGTGNFIGEITILFGSFQVAPLITAIAALGLILTSICSLSIMQRVYYGTSKSIDLDPNVLLRERLVIFFLAGLLILLGFFPQPIIDILATTISSIQYCCITNTSCAL